eukprot:2911061-Rhodomonas_salina.4
MLSRVLGSAIRIRWVGLCIWKERNIKPTATVRSVLLRQQGHRRERHASGSVHHVAGAKCNPGRQCPVLTQVLVETACQRLRGHPRADWMDPARAHGRDPQRRQGSSSLPESLPEEDSVRRREPRTVQHPPSHRSTPNFCLVLWQDA